MSEVREKPIVNKYIQLDQSTLLSLRDVMPVCPTYDVFMKTKRCFYYAAGCPRYFSISCVYRMLSVKGEYKPFFDDGIRSYTTSVNIDNCWSGCVDRRKVPDVL